MATTTLSSKGQIVLPQSLRAANDWRPGTEFEIEPVAEGILLKPRKAASPFKPTTVDAVFGMARYSGAPLSLDEMRSAVDGEFAKRRA